MREDLLNELQAQYAEQRFENERIEAARAAEIREKYPVIQQLKQKRQDLVRDSIQKIGSGLVAGGLSLSEQVAELNQKIRDALKAAGLPEDYLAPVYRCPLCRDTGYVGELIKEPCSCLKAAYQDKISEKIGQNSGKKETFETFDLNIIPDVAAEGGKTTQREICRKARNICEKWANQYPENPYQTITLSGDSGLGKTFLMHAMAERLIERGFPVLTISAYQFLQTARKSFFESDSGLDELINTPILMIDDLGSEPLMKNVTIEALYVLINERQNKGLSTILSTNLNMAEFGKRYTERIESRIDNPRTGLVIVLKGRDIRKIQGVQS